MSSAAGEELAGPAADARRRRPPLAAAERANPYVSHSLLTRSPRLGQIHEIVETGSSLSFALPFGALSIVVDKNSAAAALQEMEETVDAFFESQSSRLNSEQGTWAKNAGQLMLQEFVLSFKRVPFHFQAPVVNKRG